MNLKLNLKVSIKIPQEGSTLDHARIKKGSQINRRADTQYPLLARGFVVTGLLIAATSCRLIVSDVPQLLKDVLHG